MYKGGYQIVDFAGITLSGTATTIPGLYKTLTTCDKPLLIRGLVQSSVEYTPFFAFGAAASSTTFVIICPDMVSDGVGASQFIITVTNADAVTIAASEIEGASS